MVDLGWRGWGFAILLLYALGAVYLAGFFTFFVRFRRAAARARAGDPEEVRRHNRLLRGFPNAFYAKMLGRRPL